MRRARKEEIRQQAFKRFTELWRKGATTTRCPLCYISENRDIIYFIEEEDIVVCYYCRHHKLWQISDKLYASTDCLYMIYHDIFRDNLQFIKDLDLYADSARCRDNHKHSKELLLLRGLVMNAIDRIPED